MSDIESWIDRALGALTADIFSVSRARAGPIEGEEA
jgi:hypothetical protein